jgi:predicted nucleic acid-binding protein
MANSILIDSSFLYALQDKNDKYSAAAIAFVASPRFVALVPEVVLTEVAQLVRDNLGERGVLELLDSVVADKPIELVTMTKSDFKRTREILATYQGSRLDFVDCCIMALSERLNITQICTFDRRDFSMFRPTHTGYLELLPWF